MKKKLIIALIIGAVAIALVGCGSKPTIVNIGQAHKVENQELSVVGYKTENSVEDSLERFTADGKFILVEVTSKNISNEMIDIGNNFSLKVNDKTYSESVLASVTANNSVTLNTDPDKNKKDFVAGVDGINPGFTKHTYVVFDIPKDVKLDNAYLIKGKEKNIEFKINK